MSDMVKFKKNLDLFVEVTTDLVWQDFLIPAGYKRRDVPVDWTGYLDNPRMVAATFHDRYGPDGYKTPVSIAFCVPCLRETVENDSSFLGDVWYATAHILSHELAHVAVPQPSTADDGHLVPGFAEVTSSMGHVGDPHWAQPGPEFRRWYESRLLPEFRARGGEML